MPVDNRMLSYATSILYYKKNRSELTIMNSDEINTLTYIRRLPHIQTANKPIFITWRLAFSLPASVLKKISQMKAEFEQSITDLSADYQEMQRYQYQIKQFKWYDAQLNDIALPDILKRKEAAESVREALEYYHNNRYELIAYCIMPNHVHVVVQLLMDEKGVLFPLSKITQNWKRYSARQINQLLQRSGSFWQAESYDHVIRNDKEFNQFILYTLENPVKAKLVDKWNDWQYSWLSPKIEM
jgi:putative transposase